MGHSAVGHVCCVMQVQNPVHLWKREGVHTGVPGWVGSILHHSTTLINLGKKGAFKNSIFKNTFLKRDLSSIVCSIGPQCSQSQWLHIAPQRNTFKSVKKGEFKNSVFII